MHALSTTERIVEREWDTKASGWAERSETAPPTAGGLRLSMFRRYNGASHNFGPLVRIVICRYSNGHVVICLLARHVW
jgi:hypothetical protein